MWVGRRRVKGYGANAPVEIATGVLGNTGPLRLSQQHMVLWNSVLSELLFAAQEVLIPVRALVDGVPKKVSVCTSCLKAGKVIKNVRGRRRPPAAAS